jgi:large conductance mechanosensitive channel
MLKGFKDFVLRGNVVDLAVGVAIGAAFGALVAAFSAAFINPLIDLATGGAGEVGGQFEVNGVVFPYGAFLTAIITFLITAAVMYFAVVVPVNRLLTRRKQGREAPVKAPSEDIVLLQEICDLLRENQSRG